MGKREYVLYGSSDFCLCVYGYLFNLGLLIQAELKLDLNFTIYICCL